MKKYIKILAFLVFLFFLVILFFNKHYMSFSLFQIKSGSMMPEICVGEIVLLVEQDEYKENDIITYQVDNSFFITHRIIDTENSNYITKGDANNTADKEEVKKEQIKGKVIFHSKLLGKIFSYRLYVFLLIIFFLIIF